MFKIIVPKDPKDRYVTINVYGQSFKILRSDYDFFEDDFFVATDEDGSLYVYQHQPHSINDHWYYNNNDHYYISKVKYEGDWRDSLQLIKKMGKS